MRRVSQCYNAMDALISVCMATYNGASYIRTQLSSILEQLGPSDELIIVDDGSEDQTIELIEQFADRRIRLIRSQQNKGVIRTFERAIDEATGEILFLSDQDDIWYANKVKMVLQVFENDPAVTLVLSDAQIIDGQGKVIQNSFFLGRGKFRAGILPNVVKNKFLGCTMAFKETMKSKILPFPEFIPMHDMWIGIINEFYGKSHFIEQPLMGYRRHSRNVSPFARREWWQIIVWRWQLASAFVLRIASLKVHLHSKRCP